MAPYEYTGMLTYSAQVPICSLGPPTLTMILEMVIYKHLEEK